MKRIYETFTEIAEDFKYGDYLAHQLADHGSGVCFVWQESIMEFARALDLAGFKPSRHEKNYELFWEHVTEALTKWKAGYNRWSVRGSCPRIWAV
jgi:hypothetical protein